MTKSGDAPHPPADSPLSDRLFFALGIALALLSALPFVVARYPQMSDYPAHLARYAIMLDRGHNPWLAHWYAFEWKTTGNVGVDLLIGPFAALFGLETGGRVLAGLIPPLTGLGILAVERSLRGRTGAGSLLAMACIWSPMLLIGLINFSLGLAFALLAFALWVRMVGRSALVRAAVFVPFGLWVWLCHMSAWAVLCVMAGCYELWCRRESPQDLWRAVAACLPLAAPIVAMATLGGTSGDFGYGAGWFGYKKAIWMNAMRDQDLTLDFLSLCLMGVAVCWALIRKRIDPRLGWAALAMAVFSWILPRHISGGDYVDYRMETSAVLVGALAISVLPGEGTMARVLTLLAPVPFLLRLAVTTITWQADSDLTARLLTALDHVPEGAKVASAVVTNGDRWPLNHLEHVGDYAVIRRHAWTNANFAVEHIHMLKMREGGFVDPSQRIVQKASAPVLLADFAPASGADFLWYVGAKAPASLPAGASVVWRDGPNLLVRLAKPGEPH